MLPNGKFHHLFSDPEAVQQAVNHFEVGSGTLKQLLAEKHVSKAACNMSEESHARRQRPKKQSRFTKKERRVQVKVLGKEGSFP